MHPSALLPTTSPWLSDAVDENENSFFFFLIFIGVELINNVVLVSGEQQSESVIHIHISTLF